MQLQGEGYGVATSSDQTVCVNGLRVATGDEPLINRAVLSYNDPSAHRSEVMCCAGRAWQKNDGCIVFGSESGAAAGSTAFVRKIALLRLYDPP